jgi:hypothetical protein
MWLADEHNTDKAVPPWYNFHCVKNLND